MLILALALSSGPTELRQGAGPSDADDRTELSCDQGIVPSDVTVSLPPIAADDALLSICSGSISIGRLAPSDIFRPPSSFIA